MECPDCAARIDDIRPLLDDAGSNGRVPWYRYAGPAKLRCPECGVRLRQRTLLPVAAIASAFLAVVLLKIAYPEHTLFNVMFWMGLIAVGFGLPASFKRRVKLVRDDTA